MLERLQKLARRRSVVQSQLAAEEALKDREHKQSMTDLEKELETYVADMRARWRRSVTPRPASRVRVTKKAAIA